MIALCSQETYTVDREKPGDIDAVRLTAKDTPSIYVYHTEQQRSWPSRMAKELRNGI
jgi:hypothetical protein